MSLLSIDPRSWPRSAWLTARLAMRLSNWREVAPRFLWDRALPPLRLRNGLVLQHAPQDAPVHLLFEVFADGAYRRRWPRNAAGTVLDIGGNIGAAALDFCRHNPSIVVHSYEPHPISRAMLMRNRDDNRLGERISIFSEAVGRCSDQVRLRTDGPSLASTLFAESASAPVGEFADVSMVGLAACLDRVTARPASLLKIDAEGAEADILEGLPKCRYAEIEAVALEYHNDLVSDAAARCLTVLGDARYRTERLPAREPNRGLIYAWRGPGH